VIIYSGGLGTFHELINALVAIKNRSLYKLAAPRLFCSIFWRKTLLTASKSGIIPRSYLTEIKFFSNGKTILKQLLT
jgi:predicted Rossmann-fold nucleotide-binding protein